MTVLANTQGDPFTTRESGLLALGHKVEINNKQSCYSALEKQQIFNPRRLHKGPKSLLLAINLASAL